MIGYTIDSGGGIGLYAEELANIVGHFDEIFSIHSRKRLALAGINGGQWYVAVQGQVFA
jgi:hypothetical protein